MTKAELETRVERLESIIAGKDEQLENWNIEWNRISEEHFKEIKQMEEDFNCNSNYVVAQSLIQKNQELDNEIYQLKERLKHYENDDSNITKYVRRLENHITQLSLKFN